MRLLITILMLSAPLVLSLRIRRAPGDAQGTLSTTTQAPEHFPYTPSITPTDPSTTPKPVTQRTENSTTAASLQVPTITNNTPTPTTSDTPTPNRCVFGISSTGQCRMFPPGTRLAPFLRTEPFTPSITDLQFLRQTNNTSKPITSDKPTIITQNPKDLSHTPCSSSLGTCTTPGPSLVAVPIFRDNSLPKLAVTNNTPKPTTSDKPTPTMQATVFYKYTSPEATAATSVHLPQLTNTLVSPTTSYTPTPTTPYPPQPQPTRPATNRQPFHDACSTIFTDTNSNPGRLGYVPCIVNIANYYDQVHYHQTIHHHNG